MNTTYQIQVVRRGVITLPKELRTHNRISEGDLLTLIDLGNGLMLLKQARSQVDSIADRLAEEWIESGESLESMLATLREVRRSYAAGEQ